MTDIRRCPKCGDEKPLIGGFYRNKSARNGRTSYCKECHRALNNGVDPRTRLGYNLRSLYNMSIDQYDAMYVAQNGACAICLVPRGTKNLAVDHDHACCDGARSCGGCIRSLLCQKCNHAIGLLGDDAERMRRAGDYIDSHR